MIKATNTCDVCGRDSIENYATGACDVISVCGNKIIEGKEECDDGNLINLDGCNSECIKEVRSSQCLFSNCK